jgi:repressor LexA
MPPTFTARQGQYLAFIHRFTARHGVAPSFEQIAAHFGTSAPAVNTMIKTLDRRGLLSRVPGVARSLRVLVSTSDLPESDFVSTARASPKAGSGSAAAVSAEDVGTAAALAVADLLLPRLAAGQHADRLVLRAAASVRSALAAVGLGGDQAQRVEARLAAEMARWRPGGTIVRRRRWVR